MFQLDFGYEFHLNLGIARVSRRSCKTSWTSAAWKRGRTHGDPSPILNSPIVMALNACKFGKSQAKKHAFQGVFNRKGLRVECWLWNRPWSGAYGLLRYVLLQGRLCFFFAVNLNLTRIFMTMELGEHARSFDGFLSVCMSNERFQEVPWWCTVWGATRKRASTSPKAVSRGQQR